MIDALLDTTVMVHLYRRYPPAMIWFKNQQRYGVTSITWLEMMHGVSNKESQRSCRWLLGQFDLTSDQQWAMQQLEQFQFSHHIGKEDCLIAAVAQRLQLPLYTHNLKHMMPLISSLAVKPYV